MDLVMTQSPSKACFISVCLLASLVPALSFASAEDAERGYNQCLYELSRIDARIRALSDWRTVKCHYFLERCKREDRDLELELNYSDMPRIVRDSQGRLRREAPDNAVLNAWRNRYNEKANTCMMRLDRLERLQGTE